MVCTPSFAVDVTTCHCTALVVSTKTEEWESKGRKSENGRKERRMKESEKRRQGRKGKRWMKN